MGLADDLERWAGAALISPEQVAAIAAFEAGRSPTSAATAAPVGRAITATEVVAYAGTVVILVGLAFLVGVQHDRLGTAGRLLVFALVVASSLGVGLILDWRSVRPAARRARSAAFALASLAIFGLFAEAFVDAHLLTRDGGSPNGGPQESGNLFLAAALGSVAGGVLLFRTWSGLVAVAAAICVYSAAGTAVSFFALQPGWGPEGLFLAAGAVLAICSEIGRARKWTWSVEILVFIAVLPPVIAALTMSNYPAAGGGLESLAAGIAILAFVASIPRGSGGYALAGGVSLFLTTLEVGFRHFAQSLGFPVVLIASGLVMLALAVALVRLLPRLARRRSGHLGGDGVDLGEQLGE